MSISGRNGRRRLALYGELDLASAPQVDGAIRRLCEDGASEIEVDLRGLDFIDSTGIQIILIGKNVCHQHDVDFFLIRTDAGGPIARIWELAGLDEDVVPWKDAD